MVMAMVILPELLIMEIRRKVFELKKIFSYLTAGIFSPTTDSFKLGYRMKNGVEADDSWSSSLLSVSAIIIQTVLLVKMLLQLKLKSYLQCRILMNL